MMACCAADIVELGTPASSWPLYQTTVLYPARSCVVGVLGAVAPPDGTTKVLKPMVSACNSVAKRVSECDGSAEVFVGSALFSLLSKSTRSVVFGAVTVSGRSTVWVLPAAVPVMCTVALPGVAVDDTVNPSDV